MASPSRP
nr:TPA_asm: M47 uORF [Murid betaherpesvirus 1]DBA07784.1 TPA_asm: M47 uORF [Murid betaherpesvirus 1]